MNANPQSRFAINVEAEIKPGSYHKLNMMEYQVSFRIANTGSTSIEFDQITAAWVPINGTPLVAKIRRGSDLPALNELLPRTKDALMPPRKLELGRANKGDSANLPSLDV